MVNKNNFEGSSDPSLQQPKFIYAAFINEYVFNTCGGLTVLCSEIANFLNRKTLMLDEWIKKLFFNTISNTYLWRKYLLNQS